MKKTKRKPKSNLKKLQEAAEQAWKDLAYKRDGKRCMVKLHDPSLDIPHTNVFQVDHCFERGDKNLFLEPSNATVVCSTCNMLKGFNQRSLHRIIDDIVREREGDAKFDAMRVINESKSPNPGWKMIPWLEEQIKMLKEKADGLMTI